MMIKTKFVVISMFSRSVYLTSSSPYQFSISLSFCVSVFLSLSLFLTQAYTHIFPISLSPFLYISQVMMTLTERSQDKVKCSSKWLKTKQLAISFMPILSADFLLGTKVHVFFIDKRCHYLLFNVVIFGIKMTVIKFPIE